MRPVLLCAVLLLSACASSRMAANSASIPSPKEQSVLSIAKASEAAGDDVSAVRFYRQAMTLSTGAVDAHLALAELLIRQNKNDEATKVLEAAAKVAVKSSETYGRIAKLALKAEQPELALSLYDRALALDAKNPGWHAGKGAALDWMERHEDAQKVYRDGLQHAPKDVRLLSNLGLSLTLSGKADEAVTLLESHKKDKEMPAALRQTLALAYGVTGQREKARAWMDKDLSEAQIQDNFAFYARVRERTSKGGQKLNDRGREHHDEQAGQDKDDHRDGHQRR